MYWVMQYMLPRLTWWELVAMKSTRALPSTYPPPRAYGMYLRSSTFRVMSLTPAPPCHVASYVVCTGWRWNAASACSVSGAMHLIPFLSLFYEQLPPHPHEIHLQTPRSFSITDVVPSGVNEPMQSPKRPEICYQDQRLKLSRLRYQVLSLEENFKSVISSCQIPEDSLPRLSLEVKVVKVNFCGEEAIIANWAWSLLLLGWQVTEIDWGSERSSIALKQPNQFISDQHLHAWSPIVWRSSPSSLNSSPRSCKSMSQEVRSIATSP